jgi:hypothetical protein
MRIRQPACIRVGRQMERRSSSPAWRAGRIKGHLQRERRRERPLPGYGHRRRDTGIGTPLPSPSVMVGPPPIAAWHVGNERSSKRAITKQAVAASPRSPSLLRVQRRFPCLRYPALLIRPQGSLCVDRNRNQDACLQVDPGGRYSNSWQTLSRGSRASSATWASTSDSMARRRTRNPGPGLAVLGLVGAREFRQGRLHVFSSPPPREDSNATLRSGDILDRLLCQGGAPRLWGRD